MTDFLQEIKQETSKPESSEMSEENREAIKHLAEEIKEIKTDSSAPAETENLEKELKSLKSELKLVRTALKKSASVQKDIAIELGQVTGQLHKEKEINIEVPKEKLDKKEEESEEELSEEDIVVSTPDGTSETYDTVEEAVKSGEEKTDKKETGKTVGEKLQETELSEEQEKIVEVLTEADRTLSSGQIKKRAGLDQLGNQAVRDRIKPLRNEGIIDTHKGEGYSLDRESKAVTREEKEKKREDSDVIENATKKQLEALQTLKENGWMTAKEIAEEVKADIGQRAAAGRIEKFKDEGLVVSSQGEGYKLTEEGGKRVDYPRVEDQIDEEKHPIECMLCGKKFKNTKGFGGHLAQTHDINKDDIENPSTKLDASSKTEEEIERIKEQLGETISPTKPDYKEASEPLPYDHYTMAERKRWIRKILKESEKPLTRKEIAEKLYNLEEEPDVAEPHYNVISSIVKEMFDEEEIVKAPRMGVSNQVAYTLPSQSSDKEYAKKVLASKEGVSGRREWRSYKNTLAKLVHQDKADEVTYYDFEEYWGGNQDALQAFRTLFSHSEVLNALRKKVCPDKNFSWTQRGNGDKPTNWVLKIG